MGFEGKSNESTGSVRKLWTGCENFTITAINPTNQELKEKLGYENTEEPNYLGEEDGKRKVKISVYLDNADTKNPIRTRADFFIVNEAKKSTGGKPKYCNAYG